MLVKGRGRQRTEVETEHVHSLADELVDGLEIVPDVLLAVFSGDGGLAELSTRLVDAEPFELAGLSKRAACKSKCGEKFETHDFVRRTREGSQSKSLTTNEGIYIHGNTIFIVPTSNQQTTHAPSQHGLTPSALQMNHILTRALTHQPGQSILRLLSHPSFMQLAQPEDKLLVQIKRSLRQRAHGGEPPFLRGSQGNHSRNRRKRA